jgi:hypothetical protein
LLPFLLSLTIKVVICLQFLANISFFLFYSRTVCAVSACLYCHSPLSELGCVGLKDFRIHALRQSLNPQNPVNPNSDNCPSLASPPYHQCIRNVPNFKRFKYPIIVFHGLKNRRIRAPYVRFTL